jgi:hypothetical protein
MKYFVIIILCLSLPACSKDQNEIDDRLLPYFNRFVKEASARGKVITLDNLAGQISEIQENNVVAQCTKFQTKPNLVKVAKEYWQNGTESEKEFYIFHELGHCLLNRDHLDTKDASGNCLSIMHSTSTACKFSYSEANRKSYLDELFK